VQPAPSPRFLGTPPPAPTTPPERGAHTDEVLADIGFGPDDVEALRGARAAV
jgi:alpha-methylacyl-CoA racemase